MNGNLRRWAPAIGALARIGDYQHRLGAYPTYFERLRVVNEALGGNWVFRLADAVGLETIKANRPSWIAFYVDDIDRLHCPLDPGAPETEAFLGRGYSDMDLALYAGMGFDGYRLALQTQRLPDLRTKSLRFDNRFVLELSQKEREKLEQYDADREVPKADYYSAYGDALSVLFDQLDNEKLEPKELECLAAGCLILMCGGHTGCLTHVSGEIRFRMQMESMVFFKHARGVMTGQITLTEHSHQSIRAVS